MATMVYQYGTHSSVTLPDPAWAQLRLAHRMRNALVEAELDQQEQTRALWSGYPQVADIEARLESAEVEVARLAEKARAEHSADRSNATRPRTAADLRAARATVRELKAARRLAIGEAYLVLKPALEALRADHKARLKAIRQEYAAAGLYWGVYNAILDDHRVSVDRIRAMRAQGRAAQVRFHRWQGEGTLTVQLQRQVGDPVRSPALLASGEGKWRNVLRVSGADADPAAVASMSDAQRKATGADRGRLLWQLGGGATMELPVTVHRPLPPDADVTGAQLTVRRVGSRQEISVAVTVHVPDPTPPASGEPVALHVGWRQRADGSVRVGTWAAGTPLDVPAGLSDVVVSHNGGRWGEVVLPAGWLDLAGRPPALRARRDLNLAPVIEKLAGWLDEYPQPATDDRPELTGAVVRRWRSAARLAALAWRWHDQPPAGEGAGEIVDLLWAWRRQDKHLWDWEANSRTKLGRRRDNAWRRVGAWLAGRAGLLVMDDSDLAVLRRRQDVVEDDPLLPGHVQEKARARAALAAPGRLRELVRGAAVRRGVTVREVSSAYLSRTCPQCTVVGDADPRYAVAAVVVCPSCGVAYDQDQSAVGLMLARERSGSKPAPGEHSRS